MIPWNAIAMSAVAAISFGSGALVTNWKHGNDAFHAEQTRQHAEQLARELIREVANETSTAISGIRIENRTIYQTARTEILREPVYSDCLVPAAGGLLVNEARGQRNDRSGADAAVPGNPAGANQDRRQD